MRLFIQTSFPASNNTRVIWLKGLGNTRLKLGDKHFLKMLPFNSELFSKYSDSVVCPDSSTVYCTECR